MQMPCESKRTSASQNLPSLHALSPGMHICQQYHHHMLFTQHVQYQFWMCTHAHAKPMSHLLLTMGLQALDPLQGLLPRCT